MIANLISQKTLISGVGNILLDVAQTGFTTVGSVFNNGDKLFYAIIDGQDRETGVGTFNSGPNSITRDTVFENVVGGVHTIGPGSPLSVTANGVLSCSPSIQALTTHMPMWKRVMAQLWLQTYAAPPTMAAFSGGIRLPYFSASIDESISTTFLIGHDAKAGAEMTVGVNWTANDSSAGKVRWGLEVMSAAPGAAFSSTGTMYIDADTPLAADTHIFSEFASPVVMTSPNTLVVGRLFREGTHANDDYANTAGLISVVGAYQGEYVGTPQKDTNHYDWI